MLPSMQATQQFAKLLWKKRRVFESQKGFLSHNMVKKIFGTWCQVLDNRKFEISRVQDNGTSL